MLNGEWLGGDSVVSKILNRDHNQVYNTSIKENLEVKKPSEKWRSWMEVAIDGSGKEMKHDRPSSQMQQ